MARQSSHVSKRQPKPAANAMSALPAFDLKAIQRPTWRRPLLLAPLGLALVGCAVIAVYLGMFHSRHALPDVRSGTPEWSADPEEVQLVERFMALKNASDPEAEQLLAPPQVVEDKPVSEAEADRIQTECFLRQNLRILSVRFNREKRWVLATKGNVSAPTLPVRTATGVDRVQRTMSNPDLIVEVRDDKVHGVRAQMPSGR
jgi:hypothetical protein